MQQEPSVGESSSPLGHVCAKPSPVYISLILVSNRFRNWSQSKAMMLINISVPPTQNPRVIISCVFFLSKHFQCVFSQN